MGERAAEAVEAVAAVTDDVCIACIHALTKPTQTVSKRKMSPRKLFTVEDTCLIMGLGLVPVPGIIPRGEERFRVGDPILLTRPDGSSLPWQIRGFEFSCGEPPRDDVHILLKGLDKQDVPIGTEVWSFDVLEPGAARDRGVDRQPPKTL